LHKFGLYVLRLVSGRTQVSVAILAQCSGPCFAVVSAMAMSRAFATAEVASAIAERCFTAEMIRAHTSSSQAQPYWRSNEAWTHFRDTMEIGFTPTAHDMDLDLQQPTIAVRECTHGRGEEFHFQQGAPLLRCPFRGPRCCRRRGRALTRWSVLVWWLSRCSPGRTATTTSEPMRIASRPASSQRQNR
jgi:hypothetical protein